MAQSRPGPPVRFVRDGENVSAGVDGRPLRSLDAKVNYLWEIVHAIAGGEKLIARQVSLDTSAAVGQPVYFDGSTQTFVPGLARLLAEDGLLSLSATARIVGVVRAKSSSTVGDVLLSGLDEIDLTESAGEASPAAGLYYLSNSLAGRLTATKPAIVVPVLESFGDGRVLLRREMDDAADRHSHYSFQLAAVPAGVHSPPDDNDPHVITDADSDLPGWLPADDPIFEGKAPSGAAWGYNISAHPALAAVWPPPAGQVYLEWDTMSGVGFSGVPSTFCTIDSNGIWWMTDCHAEVPWPEDIDTTSGDSESVSESEAGCPRTRTFEMRLWFSRVQYATAHTVVTSLVTADDRVLVRCQGGDTGRVGDLEIALNLPTARTEGSLVATALKDYDPATSKFTEGPIASGLVAVGANVTITGSESVTVGDSVVHYGQVSIGVDTQPTRQLDTQLYRADGVTTEYYRDVPFLGFPEGRNVNVRGRIRVPDDLSYASPRMRIRLRVLGAVAGDLPDMALTARRLPAPGGDGTTPVSLPDESEEFTVTAVTALTLDSTYQYVDVISELFDVEAGDTVLFLLTRDGETDGYPGLVGLIETAADVQD